MEHGIEVANLLGYNAGKRSLLALDSSGEEGLIGQKLLKSGQVSCYASRKEQFLALCEIKSKDSNCISKTRYILDSLNTITYNS